MPKYGNLKKIICNYPGNSVRLKLLILKQKEKNYLKKMPTSSHW